MNCNFPFTVILYLAGPAKQNELRLAKELDVTTTYRKLAMRAGELRSLLEMNCCLWTYKGVSNKLL